MKKININLLTNLCSILISLLGIIFKIEWLKLVGFYSLSGALTNWVAIIMLFEKIPMIYGSGVIPRQFLTFKVAIKNIILDNFLQPKYIKTFLDNFSSNQLNLHEVIKSKVNSDQVFYIFIDSIMDSQYGAMINSFLGGKKSLLSMKNIFNEKLDNFLLDLTERTSNIINSQDNIKLIKKNFEYIIDLRLSELTPKIVKDIMQKIIKNHLSWLVIWGGVLGGTIGLLMSFVGG